ncbi:MAG: hypothetical protein IKG97_02850 [Lachnospiraceae bacterium]|nr:hypothetical protein [Lachnospiraceae bacterium]
MEGTPSIREVLRQAASSGRVANAYLLTGGTGEARLSEARTFARMLIKSPADLKELSHEKPNLISVDEVRSQIVRDTLIRPYGEGRKVYIVDEAEKMNPQAENALLKTLEEPPSYVVILLLSDRREYFLETILSRVVKLSLEEEEEAEDPDAPVRALMLRGSRMSARDVITFSALAQKKKETRTAFTAFLRIWFRDVLAAKSGAKAEELANQRDVSEVREYAEHLSFEGIGRILREIDEAERKFQANVNYDIVVTVLFSIIRLEMEKTNG